MTDRCGITNCMRVKGHAGAHTACPSSVTLDWDQHHPRSAPMPIPSRRLTRPDLRILIRLGDVDAGVELIQRAHFTSVTGMVENVREHKSKPVPPEMFNAIADAWAIHNEKETAR